MYAAAINDNENVANMLGLNINRYKIVTFTMTSVMIGIAGWFAAHYFGTFAGVTYLPLQFMLKVLLVVMIGGRGEIYGCVVGAYFIALLEAFPYQNRADSLHPVPFHPALTTAGFTGRVVRPLSKTPVQGILSDAKSA